MDIITYSERLTIIQNPDGTFKGGEVNRVTGYLEDVPVADAAGGLSRVFREIKTELVAVARADLATYLPAQATLTANLLAVTEQRNALLAENERMLPLVGKIEEQAEALRGERSEHARTKIDATVRIGELTKQRDYALDEITAVIDKVKDALGPETDERHGFVDAMLDEIAAVRDRASEEKRAEKPSEKPASK